MARFVQRSPHQKKPIWFKQYQTNENLGKRVIYVATDTLGFEIAGFPQNFISHTLVDKKLVGVSDNIEYVVINQISSIITPIKAVRFQGKLFMYNNGLMEEQDFVEDDIEIIPGYANDIVKIDKKLYVRKYAFDCSKEDDQQESTYQPIQGLMIGSAYLSIKTENFCNVKDKPKSGDIIFYQGCYWIVQEDRKSYIYEPKEKETLHLTIKRIMK